MLKKILLLLIVLLFLPVSYAIEKGCCCDKTDPNNPANPNKIVDDPLKCRKGTEFTKLKQLIPGVNCDEVCNVQPQHFTISKCDSNFKGSVKNLRISPVQGERKFKLEFDVECPKQVSTISINRCEGNEDDCKQFDNLDKILPPATSYLDDSDDLKFKQDYTYQIIINYKNGYSSAVVERGNLGDLECLDQEVNVDFCINELYYRKYKDYLEKFGYKIGDKRVSNNEFVDSEFSNSIKHYFRSTLETSAKCNNKNQLVRTDAVECGLNEVCRIQNNKPVCIKETECDKVDAGILGLYPTKEACEGTVGNLKTCYLEKSKTIIDECKSCSEVFECFDYKSKNSCQTDNCGLKNCEWHDVFPDLGIGVCVNTKQSNCKFCTKTYGVFDSCNSKKADALTSSKQCFFSINKAFSCDEAKCEDYSEEQCGSPKDGIKLDGENKIISKSNDKCGIGVCKFRNGCFKDSDGDSSPDCDLGDDACEKDYFPPITEIFARNVEGPNSELKVRIKDKTLKTGRLEFCNDCELFVCVVTSTNDCTDAKNFYKVKYNKNSLKVQGLELLDVKRSSELEKISDLVEGVNKIKFYAQDSAMNKEVVKEYSFTACSNCQGAGVASFFVKNAKEYKGIFYTNEDFPTIVIELLNPAVATTYKLTDSQNNPISTTQPLSNPSKNFEFQPGQVLSDGKYTFTFNARASNDLPLQDDVVIEFIVDKTPPTVKITPEQGEVIENSEITIEFEFSEEVNISKAEVFEENYNVFVKKTKINDLGLTNKVGKDFQHVLPEGFDGKGILTVEAEDLAGNQITDQVIFYAASEGGKIKVINPPWGVSSTAPFDLEISTNLPANCGYLFDSPIIPNVNQETFDASIPFSTTKGGHVHESLFNLIDKEGEEHTVDVICNYKNEFFHERFSLSIDTTPPVIKTAFARPDLIQETITSTSEKYQTFFVVELDEEGFCKYSPFTQDFNSMTGLFEGFNEEPKKILETEINVALIGDHSFNVVCMNKAGLVSSNKIITFKVDPNSEYFLRSLTKKVFTKSPVELKLYSSKKAFCFYGEDPSNVNNKFTNGEVTFYHKAEVTLPPTTIGKMNFYVECQTPRGEKQNTTIEFFIDPTPPTVSVDASTDYTVKNISWKNESVKIKLSGEDPETGISYFEYKVINNVTKEVLADWNKTRSTDPFYAKTKLMVDGTKYVVLAKSVNKAGLESEIVQSEVILVDSTLAPAPCFNKEKDGNELDVDCGGSCGKKCDEGQNCNVNSDCSSNVCKNNKCVAPSCNDNILSEGFETDIDCGGQCSKCSNGKTCNDGLDCESGYCISGVCRAEDLCNNNKLDSETGETGIDCGGSCGECVADEDKDGVLDEDDNCPGTPENIKPFTSGEYEGCTEDQAYALWSVKIPKTVRDKNDDADKDGLINIEEFRRKTNPNNEDSDGDGWSDGVEVEKGTNPNDKTDHPTSVLWSLFFWLLLLAILGGLGYGSYYYYTKYGLKLPQALIEKFPWLLREKATLPRVKKPVYIPPKRKIYPKKFIKLKKIAREKKEYIPLREIRRKHYKGEEVFEKLKKFRKKSKKPVKKIDEEEVFEQLKKFRK